MVDGAQLDYKLLSSAFPKITLSWRCAHVLFCRITKLIGCDVVLHKGRLEVQRHKKLDNPVLQALPRPESEGLRELNC